MKAVGSLGCGPGRGTAPCSAWEGVVIYVVEGITATSSI